MHLLPAGILLPGHLTARSLTLPVKMVRTGPLQAPDLRQSFGAVRSRARVPLRTYREACRHRALPLDTLSEPVCDMAGIEPQWEAAQWLEDNRPVLTGEASSHRAGPIPVVGCGA
jgi:hypothetical protein